MIPDRSKTCFWSDFRPGRGNWSQRGATCFPGAMLLETFSARVRNLVPEASKACSSSHFRPGRRDDDDDEDVDEDEDDENNYASALRG